MKNMSEKPERMNQLSPSQRLLLALDEATRKLEEVERYKKLCRKNDLRTRNPTQFLLLIGQFQKFETPILLMLAHHLCQHLELVFYESCSSPQTLLRFEVLC